MASGQTLAIFHPFSNEPPASNYAALVFSNGHPCLAFDTTTQEAAIWTSILPRNYSGGGLTVYVHAKLESATSGTLGWTVEIERMDDGTTNLTSDSFASAQTITAATVPGTAGISMVSSVAISSGSNMDSLAAGEMFRLRLKRDVANDNAAGDGQVLMVEVKET